ncbi:MAG TPA: cob(I)yrinic acid a,c-diamide adenosyltransferase [Myxococcota bacterium]|nr:cob(I)yrinic acid a,c-diamide adenosyltransferase [Myxococcota bacterium]
MKIYTRGGDTGETSLFGGERVRKSAPRVSAYGEVDELNSVVGIARAELAHDDLRMRLETIQSSLFDLGGELATPGAARAKAGPRVAEADVAELERWIDALEAELQPLRNFILPGGSRAAALLHFARTVCRRAERAVIALAEREEIDALLIRYLNRLSDLLFVMARVENRRAGVAEPQWVGRER